MTTLEILENYFGPVNLTDRLVEDLEVDSLDYAKLETDLELPDNVRFETIGDIVAFKERYK